MRALEPRCQEQRLRERNRDLCHPYDHNSGRHSCRRELQLFGYTHRRERHERDAVQDLRLEYIRLRHRYRAFTQSHLRERNEVDSVHNPDLCLNYLGDSGVSGLGTTLGTAAYSFTVPAQTNFVVVVNTTTGSTNSSVFSGTVSGFIDNTPGPGACAGATPSPTPTATATATPTATATATPTATATATPT